MKQVFLSYGHLDRERARRLYEDLCASLAIHVWFDEEDLLPGMKWRPAIRKAIRESRYFIALLSEESASRRGFRHSELSQGLEVMTEFPDDQIFLIPTRLEDCEPPLEELRELTYADLFPDWDAGVARLRKSLRIPNDTDSKVRKRGAYALEVKRQTTKKAAKKKAAKRSTRPRVSDYHYRVGLVDLDARIAELPNVARELNAIQTLCLFKVSSLAPSRKAIRTTGGLPQLDIDQLSPVFYRKISPLEMDHVICISNRLLAFERDGFEYTNYLGTDSSVNERVTFASIRGLEDLATEAGVAYEVALAYGIVSDLVGYFLDVEYHDVIRGCPMDFTEDHADVAKGLANGRFCRSCVRQLNKNPTLKKSVISMLNWGRE